MAKDRTYRKTRRYFVFRDTKQGIARDEFGFQHLVGMFESLEEAEQYIKSQKEEGFAFKTRSMSIEVKDRYVIDS